MASYRTRALWQDKELWYALKEEYLQAEDPTEYLFATESKILDGGNTGNKWEHWCQILQSPYCRKDVKRWRKELELKLQAKGVQRIITESLSEKGSFQASKYLADRGWDAKRGRPSKTEIKRREDEAALLSEEVDKLFRDAGEPNIETNIHRRLN